MRKVTLAIAMLPLLASAPVLAASVSSQAGVQLAQVGAPGDQFTQQMCNLAHQNAQSYARILQLRDKMLTIQRDNEARFQALEKGRGGGGRISLGSTAILDDAMRASGGGSGMNGGYQSPGMQQELMRSLTGKIEDVDAQISFTDNQLQKMQEDNEFRFEELEKKNGVTAPSSASSAATAPAAASPGADLCAQGMGNAGAIADALGARAEAMNFQILEMQDQMQKLQEEYENRFQALESGKRADAAGEQGGTQGGTQGGGDVSVAAAGNGGNLDNGVSGNAGQGGGYDASSQAAAGQASGADSMAVGSNAPTQGGPARGEPPQTLGSIRFDANGNVIGETLQAAPRAPQSASAAGAAAGDAIASLPTDDNPNSLYQASYQYLMSGDYKAAEAGFREHVKRYPADPNTAEARFWLGESLFGQGRYPEAATVFIDTQRDYPDSKRAPENMFKLGMTLEKMDNRDVACATFGQIPERYPKAAPAILKRVADERSRARC